MPGRSYVPPVRTTATELELLRAMRDGYAALIGELPKRGALAVATAQVALETGRLKHCFNYNVGNRKIGKTDVLYTAYKCNEQFPDGWHWYLPESEVRGGYDGERIGPLFTVPPAIPPARFCAEQSLPIGISKHYAFLKRPRYAKAFDRLQAGDPSGTCRELKVAGYFTADLVPYAKAVISLTAGYERGIDQYDILQETAVPPAPAVDDETQVHSAMTNYDLEDMVSYLVENGMANLNAEFWENEFWRARTDAVKEP